MTTPIDRSLVDETCRPALRVQRAQASGAFRHAVSIAWTTMMLG
jgi:hypothetical protein